MKKFATRLILAIALTVNAIAATYAGALGGSRHGEYNIRPFATGREGLTESLPVFAKRPGQAECNVLAV